MVVISAIVSHKCLVANMFAVGSSNRASPTAVGDPRFDDPVGGDAWFEMVLY